MRRRSTLVAGMLLAGAAAAQSPYGLEVSQSELRFIVGQHDTAVGHELGRFGAPDPALAARYYRRAAVLGYPYARSGLGRLYERGDGVARDPVLAWVWFELAVAAGDANAAPRRDAVAAGLDAEQRRRASALARTLAQHLP